MRPLLIRSSSSWPSSPTPDPTSAFSPIVSPLNCPWGEKALAHYARLRIAAHTKRLVFSDGLDLPKALSLYRHFGDRTQLGFGIGTHLTNDMADPKEHPALKPLNIVMKLVRANGQPVAKLSDTPGKTLCDDETFLAYLRQVFNVRT